MPMRAVCQTAAAIVLAAGFLTVGSGPASAAGQPPDPLYRTGFERPAFVPGLLDGQDGWRATDHAARVAPSAPDRQSQMVTVGGSRLAPQPLGGLATRLARTIGYDALAAATPIVEVGVEVRLTGPSTDSGDGVADNRVSASLTALPVDTASPAAGFGALHLSSSGEVWISGSRPQDNFRVGVPVDLDRSHHLLLRLDFVRRTTQFFVDGRPIARLPFVRGLQTHTLAVAPLSLTATDAGSAAAFSATFDQYTVAAFKPVAMDVEPELCPNRRDRMAPAPLRVTLPGSAEFDAAEVDAASLRLAIGGTASSLAPAAWQIADVATAYEPHTGKERPDACTGQGPDGYPDLVLVFDGGAVAAALADVAAGDIRLFRLTGRLDPAFAATPILGEDMVRLR